MKCQKEISNLTDEVKNNVSFYSENNPSYH